MFPPECYDRKGSPSYFRRQQGGCKCPGTRPAHSTWAHRAGGAAPCGCTASAAERTRGAGRTRLPHAAGSGNEPRRRAARSREQLPQLRGFCKEHLGIQAPASSRPRSGRGRPAPRASRSRTSASSLGAPPTPPGSHGGRGFQGIPTLTRRCFMVPQSPAPRGAPTRNAALDEASGVSRWRRRSRRQGSAPAGPPEGDGE